MKFRRFISGLLFGCGCALTFAGLFASLLPAVENRQVQLVLASFSEPSANAAVNAINRFMIFALEQGWQMVILGMVITLAGALLLAYFHPRPPKAKQPAPTAGQREPRYERPPMSEAPEVAVEAPNPFAVDTYAEAQPAQVRKTKAFIPPSGPMLEKNTVEMPEEPHAAVQAEPYYSPRFEAEAHALKAEFSDASQSGSRLLVRPEPVILPAEPVKESEAPPPPPLPVPPVTSPPAVSESAPTPLLKTSPRIRSTMGRHSSASKIRP